MAFDSFVELTFSLGATDPRALSAPALQPNLFDFFWQTMPLPDIAVHSGATLTLQRIDANTTDATTAAPIVVTYVPTSDASLVDLAVGPFMLVPGPGA
jgi:hypothetical protein